MPSDLVPVISGLAAGIALFIALSAAFQPAPDADESFRQNARNLVEVRAMNERYATAETGWRDGAASYIAYTATPLPDKADADQARELRLTVRVDDQSGMTSMTLWCLGAASEGLPATVHEIRTTGCLEK